MSKLFTFFIVAVRVQGQGHQKEEGCPDRVCGWGEGHAAQEQKGQLIKMTVIRAARLCVLFVSFVMTAVDLSLVVSIQPASSFSSYVTTIIVIIFS